MWDVEYTDEFEGWWHGLTPHQQEALDAAVQLLMEYGPALGRPLVDRIKGSRHQHMKELRVSQGGALRILFAFDPRRAALLLLGGDKSGQWEQWYRTAVPRADELFDENLAQLGEELQ